jgi:Ca2+-binding RTX toxin-like protein
MKRILLATAIALLALPALAQASTCQRVGSAVAVHMSGSTDVATLSRVGSDIYNGLTPCDGATVFNTSAIFILDTTPNRDGQDFVGIDLSGGPFAPGTSSAKNGRVPEIGIQLDLQHGDNFVLVSGGAGPDTIRGGRTIDANGRYNQGLNLNAKAEEQPGKVADPDVTWQYAHPYPNPPANETFQIDGGGGNDTIDLSGGPGFDTPFFADTTIYGGSGDDHLTGGDKTDTFYADAGDDVLDGSNNFDYVSFETSTAGVTADLGNPNPQDNGALGRDTLRHLEVLKGSQQDDVLTARDGPGGLFGLGGNDLLVGGAASDGLDGGPGVDTASYARSANGVTVELGIDKTQNTGAGNDGLADVENLVGSAYADELTGDDGQNTIVGGGGKDSVSGKGGADELQIRDATADQATCGAGSDHVVADAQGTDTIFSDCESIDFAAAAPQPPTPQPPSGSDPGTPPSSPSGDHLAPSLSALKLKQKKISYKLSEPAAVRISVQRKSGRKWKTLRGALSQPGTAGLNKLRFARKLGRGSYRLSAVATDAAGNKSNARRVSFRVAR